MEVPIDNVGMPTEFYCSRRYQPKVTKRTFKADCGSYIRFSVTVGPHILKIEHDRNYCSLGCSACKAMTESATALIKSGK